MSLEKVDLIYPFSWETEFQTNMLKGLNTNKKVKFNFGLYKLEIRSLRSKWGKVTANETNIRHTIRIHNPSILPGSPIVRKVRYNFLLNRIKMAEGSTRLPLVIMPGKTKSVNFTTKLSNKKIKTWWVSHINSGEKTDFEFRYRLYFSIGRTIGRTRWQKVRGTFRTDFFTQSPSQWRERLIALDFLPKDHHCRR